MRKGVTSADGKMKFSQYAEYYMDTAEIEPKTREQYIYLLKRINAAIGHISLEKLSIKDIQLFYKKLRTDGSRMNSRSSVAVNLKQRLKDAELTQKRLSKLAGVSIATVKAAIYGKTISYASAERISGAIGEKPDAVFTINTKLSRLSECTVWHYIKLISAILSRAKRERAINENITNYIDTPKLPRTQVQYYDDQTAKRFIRVLLNEPDIRKKTALILSLFTGIRRGELCGLSWNEVDLVAKTICIRRSSQYIVGTGVTESTTKNKSSERLIVLSDSVIPLLREYEVWWHSERHKLGDRWQGGKMRLFINDDGGPIFPDTINYWLNKVLDKHNLPHITVHGLRHTFITLQLVNGVDLRTLQARSGHAQASTLLNVYAHAVPGAQDKAAQAMNRYITHTDDE